MFTHPVLGVLLCKVREVLDLGLCFYKLFHGLVLLGVISHLVLLQVISHLVLLGVIRRFLF